MRSVCWGEAGPALMRRSSASKDQESHILAPAAYADNPAFRIGSFNPDTSIRDPFSGFTDLDFGPECEQFRIRDLGDFTERFDRADDAASCPEDVPQLVEPAPLLPGTHQVQLSEHSALLSDSACRAIAAAFPLRHRWRQWVLLYSSGQHGISLTTLYR